MTGLISIYTGGIMTICMAIFHTRFSKLFKWKLEYRRNSELNKKIFFTIHLALFLIFFGFGFLTLFYARELSESVGIAFGLNMMISVFWLWRTVWQIIYFKGKMMHYVLIACFFLLSVAYFIPVALVTL